MRIRTIFSGIHRILGLLLCALFLMWFVSGIVMIYHGFPRASQEYKIARQQPLGQLSISMDSLYHLAPDSVKLQSMSIEMRFDRPIIRFSGKGIPGPFYIDSIEPIEAFDENVRTQIIQLWCDAPVLRIDTLQQVDQWIPFGRLNEEMPVYKYHFSDEAKHQLYMTSRDGRVLQFTDPLGLLHFASSAPDALDRVGQVGGRDRVYHVFGGYWVGFGGLLQKNSFGAIPYSI